MSSIHTDDNSNSDNQSENSILDKGENYRTFASVVKSETI